jgi:hypothetical protein
LLVFCEGSLIPRERAVDALLVSIPRISLSIPWLSICYRNVGALQLYAFRSLFLIA